MAWTPDQIAFDFVIDLVEGPVLTASVFTPAGLLLVMAEPEEEESGKRLILRRFHVQGATANQVGQTNLRAIAKAAMKGLGYDELVVEGAVRTTGARPGHRPRRIRFTAHRSDEAASW